jgi:hypothetical protein
LTGRVENKGKKGGGKKWFGVFRNSAFKRRNKKTHRNKNHGRQLKKGDCYENEKNVIIIAYYDIVDGDFGSGKRRLVGAGC